MKNKIYLVTVFIIIVDCIALCMFFDLFIKMVSEPPNYPIVIALLLIPVISYLLFYNHYFFRYYFKGVRKIKYSNDGIILCFDKVVKPISLSDIYSLKRHKLTQRTIIKSKKGKFIIHTSKNNFCKTQNFDYEKLKRMIENAP